MTRVDFYVLDGATDGGKDIAVCRLAAKAHARGHRVYILTGDDETARRLDNLLWTFSAGSFVPHAVHPADGDTPFPVLIGATEPPAEQDDVLIQTAAAAPACYARFRRVLEVVGAGDDEKRDGRERFRYYRDQGCTPETHAL